MKLNFCVFIYPGDLSKFVYEIGKKIYGLPDRKWLVYRRCNTKDLLT